MAVAERIKTSKSLLESLKKEVDEIKNNRVLTTLRETVRARSSDISKLEWPSATEVRCIRTLKGHGSEVTSLSWSGDSVVLASVGKDGQVIVWNALNNRKIQTINHPTQWLMTCSFERTENRLLATGGADRTCSIFITGQIGMTRPTAVLSGHDGYLSDCQFTDEKSLLTASGDSSVILWDVTNQQVKGKFTEHAADCLTVAVLDTNTFASGSADSTVKIWDIRSGRSTRTFQGHTSDVNSVAFFPNGKAVASASTDSTCRLFDIRSYAEIAVFDVRESDTPVTSGEESYKIYIL